MPHDLLPWHAIHSLACRWMKADCFVTPIHDLREPKARAAVSPNRTEQPVWRGTMSGDRRRRRPMGDMVVGVFMARTSAGIVQGACAREKRLNVSSQVTLGGTCSYGSRNMP